MKPNDMKSFANKPDLVSPASMLLMANSLVRTWPGVDDSQIFL